MKAYWPLCLWDSGAVILKQPPGRAATANAVILKQPGAATANAYCL